MKPVATTVAIFVDWEGSGLAAANAGTQADQLAAISKAARECGQIVVARAYWDWTSLPERSRVYWSGFEPVFAPVFRGVCEATGRNEIRKNLSASGLIADCADLLFRHAEITSLWIVSAHQDFSPLARRAQVLGCHVVVVGPATTTATLRAAATQFISLEALRGTPTPTLSPTASAQPARPVPNGTTGGEDLRKQAPAFEQVAAAVRALKADGHARVLAARLGQVLPHRYGFDYHAHGYLTLSDLLHAAARAGYLILERSGTEVAVDVPDIIPGDSSPVPAGIAGRPLFAVAPSPGSRPDAGPGCLVVTSTGVTFSA